MFTISVIHYHFDQDVHHLIYISPLTEGSLVMGDGNFINICQVDFVFFLYSVSCNTAGVKRIVKLLDTPSQNPPRNHVLTPTQ